MVLRTQLVLLKTTPFSLKYLSGVVKGVVAYEKFSLGGFEVSNQVFAIVNDCYGLDLSVSESSGIVGLAFPRTAAIPTNMGRNLIDNILNHDAASTPFFSIFLSKTATTDSTLTIDGHDSRVNNLTDTMYIGDVMSMPDGITYDYWKLPLEAIVIGSLKSSLQLSNSKVKTSRQPIGVFDTGTTLILGPTLDVERLWLESGGARQRPDGRWDVRCNIGYYIGFVFGNTTFFVDPTDLNREIQGTADGWCFAGIQPNDNVIGGDWLFGDTFLRNAYTVYYAAMAAQLPRLGLISLTDKDKAMSLFRIQRGNTQEIPQTQLVTISPSNHLLSRKGQLFSLGASLTVGSLFGATSVFFYKIRFHSRVRP